MTRSVEEWIGKTDDTPVPLRVKVRVFERYEGRCYLSGRKIRGGEAWQVEHVIAIINGGQNRESNLAPALAAPHRQKTNDDLKTKSKIARIRAKHLGVWPEPKRKLQGRGFEKRSSGRALGREDGRSNSPGMSQNLTEKALK